MTETWCPQAGDVVKVIDNGYSACEERPLIGQHGRVKTIMPIDGERVLVIAFTATSANKTTTSVGEKKKVFYEYFSFSRKPYLYFQPVSENWK